MAAGGSLIYSFVARGNVVLADYTTFTGNFSTVALQVCNRGDRFSASASGDRGAPRAGREAAKVAGAIRGELRSRRRSGRNLTAAAAARKHLPPPARLAKCRPWRRERRAPTPSSRTHAMDTVSGTAAV